MTGCMMYDLWGSDAMTGAHQKGQYAGGERTRLQEQIADRKQQRRL